MNTYKCTNCFNTFEGHGIYKSYNYTYCHQCALIKQQEEQYEEQRKRDAERDRLQKEEADRRYWDEVERRDRYQPASRNNNVNNSQDAALRNLANVMARQVEKIVDKKLNSVKPVNKNRCDPNVVWPEVEKPALNFIEECRIGDVYRRYLEREKEKTHLPPNYD